MTSIESHKKAKMIIGKRKKEVGSLGEMLVVKHLKKDGFSHVESNFLRRQGEIDVIMEKDQKIYFFEVKTVSREIPLSQTAPKLDVIRETGLHLPEENVSAWKIRKLSKVIELYINEKELGDKEWQFGVAVVLLDRNRKRAVIKFIKDIPLGR